jgi:hypothetical protein
VFDIVDSLFTSIGCAFEKLFGWLCYLLDWDDIKATARIFKNYISGFKDLATVSTIRSAIAAYGLNTVQEWIDTVLPQATPDFFNNCSTKLTEAFDSAKSQVGNEKVGKYDTGTSDIQTEFDNCPPRRATFPCSNYALIVSAQFLDAGDGSSAAIQFSDPISTLQGLYVPLQSVVIGLYTDELKTAARRFMTLLESFILRSEADNVTFSDLFDAVKPVINELLKSIYGLVSQIAKIAKQALNTIGDLLKAELWPSGLGAIFKYLFSTELTCVPLASLMLS